MCTLEASDSYTMISPFGYLKSCSSPFRVDLTIGSPTIVKPDPWHASLLLISSYNIRVALDTQSEYFVKSAKFHQELRALHQLA